jgi:hypothetical protein
MTVSVRPDAPAPGPKQNDVECSASASGSAAAASVQTPTPPPAEPVERRVTADRDDSLSVGFLYRLAVAQVIANLTGSVSTALLFGVALVVALRRFRQYARASGPMPVPVAMPEAAVPGPSRIPTSAPLPRLGLRYDVGRRAEDGSPAPGEVAMLQQLFEQNLQLREQLAELEAADRN